MNNETKAMSTEIVDEMIRSLLSKSEFDEKLQIELYGYPADYLNDPSDNGDSTINEKYNALIDGNQYFGFVYCYTNHSGFQLGDILTTEEPQYLLDFGSKKAWIDTKKLRSLLQESPQNGFVKRSGSCEIFYLRLNKKLLLDNVEVS